ncbi:murein DD-endopeptidase MepM/ murein hydrolase activator NlpD [Ereboglobus sp. PH5-10]|uniref:M23 family metallopeptidase n=1 Tax=Ereboglobus sp. PH5-10 TaxID=2940629 RepID=UPI0024057BD9|nr:M23 family metallopeptidase [Ereboglobus sp. PH5-10]MDF9826751.1 murein DD-endopeptidase MepM/ murein hydrolase activator NlpD [Ereboglobus sp. PH5-10]
MALYYKLYIIHYKLAVAVAAALLFAGAARAQTARLDMAWPTPNTAFMRGRGVEAYIQPTASGVVASGLYGGTRNGGRRFHEGIDLKPTLRDTRGEPLDAVFAVLPGVVRHLNLIPGNSNYGRYIVIEHPGVSPAVYSLYAHLSAAQPGLRAGDTVARGQRIATMGRSSDVIAIPKSRAHLHFELGVRLTDNFQPWYDARDFGGKNKHGVWNGMNLMGFDPLDFFSKWRAGEVPDFRAYFSRMKPAVRVRYVTRAVPDFTRRYPALLTKPVPSGGVGGWEILFNETGIPFAWTPLGETEIAGIAGEARITWKDDAILKAWRCKSLVLTQRGAPVPGRDLRAVLGLLFVQ